MASMGVARLGDDKPVSDMRKLQGSEDRTQGGAAIVRGRIAMVVAAVALGVLQGCGGRGAPQPAERAGPKGGEGTVAGPATQTPLPPGSSVDAGPVDAPVRLLFIGTSLTAGLGLDDPATAWPGAVGQIADSLGYRVAVQNAGLSGETSAGALRRADWLLKDARADVVVIETGANDGLRGTSVPQLEQNLAGIVAKVKAALPRARLVVVQMEAPPNLGVPYAKGFHEVFGRVAAASGATLTPFLLDGVAGEARLNQADGIHPTREGAATAARTVWPVLRGVLDSIRSARPAL